MKKIAVIGIAVLFSLVGFKYASAQSTMGGHLTTLSLHVTYRADVPKTKTLSEGKKLVTVASGLNKVVTGVQEYDPVIYIDFDADGNMTKIVFDWLSPNPAVVLLGCSGQEYIPLAVLEEISLHHIQICQNFWMGRSQPSQHYPSQSLRLQKKVRFKVWRLVISAPRVSNSAAQG